MPHASHPIPAGYHGVTPHLVCAGAAEAIAFYTQAFGAVEIGRMAVPDGRLAHAEVRIGDARVMLTDHFPEHGTRDPRTLQGTPVTLHMYVPDADAAWDQALAAGAKPVMPLADMFWGDRYGQVEDPFGHRWAIATRLREPSAEEVQRAMQTPAGAAA
jgi:uncharacterized glyoxalase superfamily protein PhnB